MVSVNMAMQIDLFAQANASFVGGVIHSGFGGQADFVAGSLHSAGGHAVIALHSWHQKSDTSSVLPVLTNPVTSFQHSAIVSDQGCAGIFGRSGRARPRLIIERVADPRARDGLVGRGWRPRTSEGMRLGRHGTCRPGGAVAGWLPAVR